jgi:hypothetical protein
MTGPLLAYLHLIGDMGVSKIIENLRSCHFNNKYTRVESFMGMSYGCFLTHRLSRKHFLDTYSIPEHAFEEVSVDLAENLNEVRMFKTY